MVQQTTKDSALSMASVSDQNTDIIVPSEPQGEIVHLNVSSTSEDVERILEAISDSSSDVQSDLSSTSLVAGSHIDPVDEESAGDSVSDSDDDDDYVQKYKDEWGITLPRVVISTFTETGQAEESIKVPKQRSYTGQKPVIPSSLADTPCTALSVQGTSHTLNTTSVLSLLEECIEKNYDFGTVYGHLHPVWNMHRDSNMQDELHRCEEEDRKINCVVLYWATDRDWTYSSTTCPISHAWVDEKDCENVWTPINRREWPVPIPKDANLNLIWIEMLNLGVEYMRLDVLCLRQKEGFREDLHVEEWKLDMPTIGYTYWEFWVVVYLSGLGQPLSLKEGDLDSSRSWFRRAWTVQEIGTEGRIIAGDTPDGPMHTQPIDHDGNYEMDTLTRLHKQLKVAGLALPLWPNMIPTYYESGSLEDAWTAPYPGVGLGCNKWRPTWDQVMMEPLPAYVNYFGHIAHDGETDEDWFDGRCIEKGLLQDPWNDMFKKRIYWAVGQ
ncbi:hypothetical protein ARMSODRAFT_1034567 [Armillaria solidipes]|uniref:Heterokaryon incompatibility domain-containing protein n=1 Tax=Armillaria solidipes TaxID=1076256 RepID=A0A2H3AI07_9AGAR|nr:hypothetical protein ARMSODRAFT_1034567 [Armillaria solidipes]